MTAMYTFCRTCFEVYIDIYTFNIGGLTKL